MSQDLLRQPVRILMVEDNPGDVRLAVEALREGKVRNEMDVAYDGVQALAYLNKEPPFESAGHPDLILLDLNLPLKNGFEVLRAIKTNEEWRRIPVVVLTTSSADRDILRSYDLSANCYITKPVDFQQFISVVRTIEDFWLTIVKLPPE